MATVRVRGVFFLSFNEVCTARYVAYMQWPNDVPNWSKNFISPCFTVFVMSRDTPCYFPVRLYQEKSCESVQPRRSCVSTPILWIIAVEPTTSLTHSLTCCD
jgi:hypothetical protein